MISWGFYRLAIRLLDKKSIVIKITVILFKSLGMMIMQFNKSMSLLLILFLLSGCFGSYYEPEPVGIGKGINELKLSPCACLQVELPKNLPDWYVETI